MKGQCICDQYELACGNTVTQEDLLCDACREEDDHGFTGHGVLSGYGMEPVHVKLTDMANELRSRGLA